LPLRVPRHDALSRQLLAGRTQTQVQIVPLLLWQVVDSSDVFSFYSPIIRGWAQQGIPKCRESLGFNLKIVGNEIARAGGGTGPVRVIDPLGCRSTVFITF